MFKSRLIAAAAMAALISLGALSGCASADEHTATGAGPIASASSNPIDDKSRWGEGAAPKLDDYFLADAAKVGSGGGMSPDDADNPTKPATIAKNGNISVLVTVRASEVDRSMVQSYISTDKAGNEVGPSIDCVKSGGKEIQVFKCSALFQDNKYKSGIYYAVFKSKPTVAEQKSYGSRTQIVPIYTRTWAAMELEYEQQQKSSAGATAP